MIPERSILDLPADLFARVAHDVVMVDTGNYYPQQRDGPAPPRHRRRYDGTVFKGTVHMVIGGGGTSLPSNQLFFNPLACRVITGIGATADPAPSVKSPITLQVAPPGNRA